MGEENLSQNLLVGEAFIGNNITWVGGEGKERDRQGRISSKSNDCGDDAVDTLDRNTIDMFSYKEYLETDLI